MNKKYFKELLEEFRRNRTEKEMEEFLKGILTPGELEQLTRRLQIVKMLKKGVAQREIANNLDVGIATVTRGAREVGLGRFGDVQ